MKPFIAAAAFTAATVVLLIHLGTGVAEAGSWEYCTHEGGYCAFKDPFVGMRRLVKYGQLKDVHVSNDLKTWVGKPLERAFTGGVWCRVGAQEFPHDPALERTKACWYWRERWERCMHEGGYCTVNGTKKVRYGTAPETGYVEKVVTGGIWCRPGSDAFGADPALGSTKQCWVWK